MYSFSGAVKFRVFTAASFTSSDLHTNTSSVTQGTKFKLGDGSVTELDDLPAGIYEWAVGIVKQSAPNGTTRPGGDIPIKCTGRWSDTETHG